MKKIIFPILLVCNLLVFVSCEKEKTIDSYPLFGVELDIYLSDFSEDVSVKLAKGNLEKVELNQDMKFIKIKFSDVESVHSKEKSSKEYVLTLKSKTVFPEESSEYKIKIKTDDSWIEVSNIYNNEGEEIPFELQDISNHYKIEIGNAR